MADLKISQPADSVLAAKDVSVQTSERQSTSDVESAQEKRPELKAVQRKVDLRILLWYSFIYLIMRINVSNITNTAIMNETQGDDIRQQLHLSSQQWAWVLSIFYYPYAAFEPMSTLLLKRFKPNIWMSRIMVTWGIVSMCQGATQNYAGILACRFLLGFAEAGYYPGVLYHLSFWYPADSMALRIAFFYACGQFSGTVSGLLAYALSFINGAGGLAAWRWVFLIEGIPPILLGVTTFFWLPNYPDEKASFVTAEERQVVVDSLPKTQPRGSAKTWNLDQVKALLCDPTSSTFTLIWVFHAIGGWGVGTVLPTVIYELGLTGTADAQLMTMPAYAFGCASLVFIGWLIHTKRLVSWIAAIILECIACACYVILITVDIPSVKYVFVTIALACSICIYPIIWPERIRAAHGTTAAGLAIGLTNASAQLSGIVGPQVYQPKFGPRYRVSFSISIGLLAGAIASICLTWYLVAKRDRERSNTILDEVPSVQEAIVTAEKVE